MLGVPWNGKDRIASGIVLGKNELLAESRARVHEKRATKIGRHGGRILRWNGEDHDEGQVVCPTPLHFRECFR
jgi:hypothetical protein